MKKFMPFLILLLAALLLVACTPEQQQPTGQTGDVTMIARITAIGDKIEVDVIASEYFSGPFFIITGDTTEYYNKDGESITRVDLSVGDTVEIKYNGQVMLSYPPQVAALIITKQ